MDRSSSKALRLGVASIALLAAWQCGFTPSSAWAQTPPPPATAPPGAPAAAAAPAAPTSPLTAPSFAGPLVQNPTPYSTVVPGIGTVYVTGALSGLWRNVYVSKPRWRGFQRRTCTLLGNAIACDRTAMPI